MGGRRRPSLPRWTTGGPGKPQPAGSVDGDWQTPGCIGGRRTQPADHADTGSQDGRQQDRHDYGLPPPDHAMTATTLPWNMKRHGTESTEGRRGEQAVHSKRLHRPPPSANHQGDDHQWPAINSDGRASYTRAYAGGSRCRRECPRRCPACRRPPASPPCRRRGRPPANAARPRLSLSSTPASLPATTPGGSATPMPSSPIP